MTTTIAQKVRRPNPESMARPYDIRCTQRQPVPLRYALRGRLV